MFSKTIRELEAKFSQQCLTWSGFLSSYSRTSSDRNRTEKSLFSSLQTEIDARLQVGTEVRAPSLIRLENLLKGSLEVDCLETTISAMQKELDRLSGNLAVLQDQVCHCNTNADRSELEYADAMEVSEIAPASASEVRDSLLYPEIATHSLISIAWFRLRA